MLPVQIMDVNSNIFPTPLKLLVLIERVARSGRNVGFADNREMMLQAVSLMLIDLADVGVFRSTSTKRSANSDIVLCVIVETDTVVVVRELKYSQGYGRVDIACVRARRD